MKITRIILGYLLIASCCFMFQGCDEDTDTTCTGCNSSSPWSKPGSTSTCYSTKSDCEAALGSGCIQCI